MCCVCPIFCLFYYVIRRNLVNDWISVRFRTHTRRNAELWITVKTQNDFSGRLEYFAERFVSAVKFADMSPACLAFV